MTGQDIFERALDLCALRGADGSLPADVGDLQSRAVGLLNVSAIALHALDQRLRGKPCYSVWMSSLEETVDMHEDICGAVLPYRLAALLIYEEDRELAERLHAHELDTEKRLLADGISRRHAITEVYG